MLFYPEELRSATGQATVIKLESIDYFYFIIPKTDKMKFIRESFKEVGVVEITYSVGLLLACYALMYITIFIFHD